MEYLIPIWGLLLFYIYKCVIKKEEGRHKNVMSFGRFSRTVSGVRDRVYDPKTVKLVDGENTGKFGWMWWLFESIPSYLFDWKEPGEKDKTGSVKQINQTRYRSELTNHHRNQEDYDFEPQDVETGEKNGQQKDDDNPQNVKINATIRGSIIMESPFDAQFRNSGKWHESVEATISGLFGWVVSRMVYAQLPDIRGEKLASTLVDNTEPDKPTKVKPGDEGKENPEFVFYFADENEKRRDQIKFIDCINYEILEVKRLGVKLINLTLLDYEATAESKGYIDALQKNAISEVNLQTSTNNAKALDAVLEVKKAKAVELINTAKQAKIDVMKTEDATAIKVAEHLKNVKVWSAASGTDSDFDINVNEIVHTALNIDMADLLDLSDKKTGGK